MLNRCNSSLFQSCFSRLHSPSSNKAKFRSQMTNTRSGPGPMSFLNCFHANILLVCYGQTSHHLLISAYSSCVTLLLTLWSFTAADFSAPFPVPPTPHSEEMHPGSPQLESYNETLIRTSFAPPATPCPGPHIPTAATAGSANLNPGEHLAFVQRGHSLI